MFSGSQRFAVATVGDVVNVAVPAARRYPLSRVLDDPGRLCVAIFLITVAGLALDRWASLAQQHLLGVVTALILIVALIPATRLERAQTLVVVGVATCFEVIGSVIWGVYIYRWGNLPLFVPPGHGLVYLFGLRLTQTGWAARNPHVLIRVAIVGAIGWAVTGLTLLPRTDVGGAIGVAVLVIFLLRGRVPQVYAGVFLFVAFLEFYGTWIGTWFWQPEIPGTGIANGNPPSGIAAGYVFFDIAAIATAPYLLRVFGRISRLGRSSRAIIDG
jgi:hypothetical protein